MDVATAASLRSLSLSSPPLPDVSSGGEPIALPINLVLHWALRGDLVTMGRVAAVCREWREAAAEPYLWRALVLPRGASGCAFMSLMRRFHAAVETMDLARCKSVTSSHFISALAAYATTPDPSVSFADAVRGAPSASPRVETFHLTHLNLTCSSVSALIIARALRGRHLKELKVHGVKDDSREPGDAIPRLERLADTLDVSAVCEGDGECLRLSSKWDAEESQPELGGFCVGCHEPYCQLCLEADWMERCGACKQPMCEECDYAGCDVCDEGFCEACVEGVGGPQLLSCEACGKMACLHGDEPCAFYTAHYNICDDCDSAFVRAIAALVCHTLRHSLIFLRAVWRVCLL